MSRFLPGAIAMAAVVVASNILVQYPLGGWLTWGALTYPVAFLVTDVMNRVYGAAAARQVVIAGFLAGIGGSLIAAGFDKTTLRIALASGLAYVAAQTLDISIFDRLRHGAWWKAPLVSSFFGSALDTLIFFGLAFSSAFVWIDPADNVAWANEMVPLLGVGPLAPAWASLGMADWLVKMGLAISALLPFRMAVSRMLAPSAQIR